jgi:hypothetical protein
VSLCFSSLVFGQTNMFKESTVSIAHHFENSEVLKKEAITDRYDELTRSEGFVVEDIVTMGSVFTKRLHRSGKVIFNCPAGEYLNKIKSKLLEEYPKIDKLIRVYVTEDPSLNAFATVNNNIYVNIGLLARLENEAQLAFILSHEILHIVDAHIINGTLKLSREAKVYNKSNVGIDDNLFELRRHEVSREHETQADLLGFELYLKQKYDALEGVTALQLLEKANDFTIDFQMNQGLFYLSSVDEYDAMVKNYRDHDEKRNEDIDSIEFMTHPLLSVRIDQMAEIMKTIPADLNDGIKFLVSETDFKEMHRQANERINEIYAEDLNFIALFLNSSALLTQHKDASSENLNYLGYSLQGLLIDHYNKIDLGSARSTNPADSLFSHFYQNASKIEFSKWVYHAIDTIYSQHPSVNLKRYYQVIAQTIVNEKLDSLEAIFGADLNSIDLVATDNKNGLDISEITFEVSPFSDLSMFKVAKFNEFKRNKEKNEGKLAIVGMNLIHLRRAEFLGNYTVDLPKMEVLERRADKVCENLEKDYSDRTISLLPNPKEYDTDDYEQYDKINQWMSERIYFNNRYYVSIHEDEIRKIVEEDKIKYAFSSVNVGVKSFSIKNFLAVYFSPFIMPLYVPQLAGHIANSSVRKYQLSLVFNIETGALEYWDKRTYLEPNSTSQLQIVNNDILKTFFNE